MDFSKEALELHKKTKGKIEVNSKVPLKTTKDLSLAYTPGVAAPCLEIKKDKSKVYDYTSKWNTVAIISDGSAVLGLGNIGPEAALPVMEGKAILFKEFANIDAFPICLNTQDTEEIIKTVKLIAPSFGGINLEDISAPRCFEIEEKLKQELDIPVFHDDQHGTAVVTLAALTNALKVVNKNINEIKIVISGAGAGGIAVSKILKSAGATNLVLCDSQGIISKERKDINLYKAEFAVEKPGILADALKNSDIFIGVSAPNIVTKEMVQSMKPNPIVFALANPVPEIMPDLAKEAGAKIVATGRSDFPNQINNVLAFPGILRGALDARAQITEEMKLAAAQALASMVEPTEEKIVPSPLEPNISQTIAEAVKKAAK